VQQLASKLSQFMHSVHNGLDVHGVTAGITTLTLNWSISQHSFVDWMCFELISHQSAILLFAIFSENI